MDESDEKDALWDLLGNARQVKASPYFARKVLRAVKEDAKQPRFNLAILLRWLVPTSVAAAVALTFCWSSYQTQRSQEQAEFNAAFDAAADMQSLVAVQETAAWTDSQN